MAGTKKKRAYSKRTPRAGKRRCFRCMEIWERLKGMKTNLCLHCRTHCKRCDASFDDVKRGHQKTAYQCYKCEKEVIDLSRNKDKGTDRRLTTTYGITLIEYNAMLKAQDGVCWICQQPPKEGGRRLAVDHLHSKGEKRRNPREKRSRVRGLLCWACNGAIGKFRDDIAKLRRAADYLEQWPGQDILKEKK